MSDFPVSEYETRLAAVQRRMHGAGMDAILLTTEAEVRYFSGFRTPFWQSPTRPWFLVIPADGKPVAVIPEIGAAAMRRTWVEDIRTWASPDPVDDGVSLLASVLDGCGRVGLPMGRESSLRMPLRDFEDLRGRLRGAEFADASDMLRQERMVKSEAEIDRLRRICGIASDAFADLPGLAGPGVPLSEVFRRFRIALLQRGADDVPYLVGAAGQGGYGDVISPPAPTPLRAGDVLMLDTGAALDGYYCDFDRNFAVGAADESVRSAYRTLVRAVDAGLATARPGATCAGLFRAMAAVVGGAGGDVGRMGHGLGIQLTESPSLAAFDDTVLRPGMVLTLEPSIALAPGRMLVHEENIVIRDGEPELLSRRAAEEMAVIA
ncbi:MAG: M24 family metallopeptidase [Paracoccaceae bacterium]